MNRTLYVRNLTTGREEALSLPVDKSPLNPDQEYIILDSIGIPFSVSEYDSIKKINKLLKRFAELEINESVLEALGNTYLFREIEEAFNQNDDPFLIINVTDATSGWNYGQGIMSFDDDAIGLCLHEEGFSYLPFDIPEEAKDYIRWEQNWFSAESDGWRKTKDHKSNLYLVKRDF